jgi:ABC-type transport system involved in cytochrome bd biosynthesis fused ATPase/permease subunit
MPPFGEKWGVCNLEISAFSGSKNLSSDLHMDLSTLNHFLIGLPGSGKSTFADVLASLDDNAVIISSDEEDQGSEIETHLLKQTQAAIAQGKTVIYDGTNAQRAHRLDWLKKVEAIVGSSHRNVG